MDTNKKSHMNHHEHHNHKGHEEHKNHMNHNEHHSHEGHDHHGNFKQKFFISLMFAIPIIILSPMMGFKLPFQFTFTGSDWIVLILATILFFYGGQPFLAGAKDEIKIKNLE